MPSLLHICINIIRETSEIIFIQEAQITEKSKYLNNSFNSLTLLNILISFRDIYIMYLQVL